MSTAKKLILVTGASGFVASHIVDLLLKSGYAVRGTVRSNKVETIQNAPICANSDGNFSVVGIDDVATGDFKEALRGVDAIIHVASPLAMGGKAADNLALAKNGMTNILRQALDAGITKAVVTSTFGALMDPEALMTRPFEGRTFTTEDWGKAPEEDFVKNEGNVMWTYVATKIVAEHAAWNFAKENPKLDLATINPPFIFGPLQKDFPPPPVAKLSSNEHIYSLVFGDAGRPLGFQLAPTFVDVRDVATAHVRALSVPPAPTKRYLVSGGFLLRKPAVEYLAKAHPTLRERLPSLADAQDFEPSSLSKIDTTKAKKELGMDDYIPWEKTLDDTVASLLALEDFWQQT